MSERAIVVGVDLSRGACEAVWWALVEARRRGAPVLLLHARDAADAELAAAGTTAATTAAQAAQAVLDNHLAHTARLAAEIPVSGQVVDAAPVEALVGASRDAQLIVLGSRGRAGLRLSALGSVSQRVAVHAHCPVVIVPEGAPRLLSRRVAAGVTAGHAGHLAVDFAADEASRWDAQLVLLRARGVAEDERVLAARETEDAIDRAVRRHADLEIETRSPAADPAAAFITESRHSDLVVLGCHHTEDPFNCRLGAVPSGVLAQADCPVVLVGQPA